MTMRRRWDGQGPWVYGLVDESAERIHGELGEVSEGIHGKLACGDAKNAGVVPRHGRTPGRRDEGDVRPVQGMAHHDGQFIKGDERGGDKGPGDVEDFGREADRPEQRTGEKLIEPF